jgi:hypothetical protein
LEEINGDLLEADFWTGTSFGLHRDLTETGAYDAHGRRNSRGQDFWTMDNASLGSQGGDAEAVHCPPVLKITQCVLIRLENFLFYLILQGLPKFAF